jgi:alcohol dehydrogenase YqhD (iron-dependent ADH family)
MVMNFDINALKHHQLVEDGLLEGCYLHQPARGSQQNDKAVVAERQALEKMGYKVIQVQAKGGTMQTFMKKTGHQLQ